MNRQDVLIAFACDADATGTEPAVVTVQRTDQTLAFCAHHYRQHEVMLAAFEWVVTEDRRSAIPELEN